MKTRIVVSILALGMVAMFQNCSNVDFTKADSSSSNAKLVPLDIEPGELPVTEVEDEDDDTAEIPVKHTCDGHKHDDMTDSEDNASETGRQPEQEEEANDDDDAAGDLVACILVDHGKSLKLGLIEEALGGVNSVARSVCISRQGCLTKVSAKFQVLGAYDRGYCKHNPNVVRLTDAQLTELLK